MTSRLANICALRVWFFLRIAYAGVARHAGVQRRGSGSIVYGRRCDHDARVRGKRRAGRCNINAGAATTRAMRAETSRRRRGGYEQRDIWTTATPTRGGGHGERTGRDRRRRWRVGRQPTSLAWLLNVTGAPACGDGDVTRPKRLGGGRQRARWRYHFSALTTALFFTCAAACEQRRWLVAIDIWQTRFGETLTP